MRTAAVAVALLLGGCAAPEPAAVGDAPAAGSATLLGPVTAFASVGGRTFACSQAGIAAVDATLPLVPDVVRVAFRAADPGFRVVGLAARGDDLLACGGTPGEAGFVARLAGTRDGTLDGARDGVEVGAQRRLADDLVSCIAVAADGTVVCGCDDGRVLALDAATLAPRAELRRHTAPVRGLALSGDLLASVGLDGNVILGALDAAPRVLRDHTAGVECAAWSADGAVLASGSRDGRVRFHDRSGRLLRSTEPLRAAVLCIAAHGDDRFVFGTDDGRVLSASAAGAAAPRAWTEAAAPVHALWTDGERLLAGRRGRVEIVPGR